MAIEELNFLSSPHTAIANGWQYDTGVQKVAVTVTDYDLYNNDAGNGSPTNWGTKLWLGASGGGSNGNGGIAKASFAFTNDAGAVDPVTNVSFTISDIDSKAWTDVIRIVAYDPQGNVLPDSAIATSLGSNVSRHDGGFGGEPAAGVTLASKGAETQEADASGTATITISGVIARYEIYYSNAGTGGNKIYISPTTYETNAVLPDGIVEGTAGADLIDVTYTGDPEGDRIDNNDNTGAGVTAGGVAGSNDDLVQGFAGNDTIKSGLGNDTVYAGDGADSVDGGAGDDVLYGYGDTLNGHDDGSNDTLLGGDGKDSIYGGAGDDLIYGDTTIPNGTVGAADFIDGGDGNDTIYGGAGNDTIHGGAGDDWITGNTGNDLIYGGDGNDTIVGGGIDDGTGQNDTIYGGAGNDSIEANIGDDLVYGGTGDDRILAGEGDDTVYGEDGKDTIYGNEGNDYLDGGNHDDYITGGHGDDTVLGGAGNDSLIGGTVGALGVPDADDTLDGADSMDGGSGDDTIRGLYGNDTLLGGSGNDSLDGGWGNDSLDGGTGNDSLDGGHDNDTLKGGDGQDTIAVGQGDVAFGGADQDLFKIDPNQIGTGHGTITGGENVTTGADHDVLDSTAINSGVSVNFTGFESGDLNSGSTTYDFTQIEHVVTGAGNDTVDGSTSSYGFSVDTGAGNDKITGSTGNDTIVAGAGADTISGGKGDDKIDLGANDGVNDTVVLQDGSGNDTVSGFKAPIDTNGDGIADTRGDQFDVTNLLNKDGNSVTSRDLLKGDGSVANATVGGINGTLITFPNGETVFLPGVDATELDTAGELYLAGIPCFTTGTLIETAHGAVAIETLAAGDLVLTRDNGLQPVRWIGSRTLAGAALAENLRPILIRKGALGVNTPSSDLLVSPQHRVLVRSKIAQKMFGTDEVLVAAKQLCQIDGIDIAEMAEVTYVHILFDRHEVVISNGAETESLFTGPEALKSVGRAARDEIFAIFPELADRDYAPVAARELVSGRMGRKLAVRHAQNRKPLIG